MTARIEDKGDRIVVWNGNAHKRGALSPELYACIGQAMELAKEPRIRAVILTSEGDFFCAGGDLNILIARREMDKDQRRGKIEELHDLIRGHRGEIHRSLCQGRAGARWGADCFPCACTATTTGYGNVPACRAGHG